MKYPNGSESILSHGPFAQLLKVKNAICEDNKPRIATITGQPDTFFSIPASVKAQGKTITGFLSMAPTYKPNVLEGYIFTANKYGKNGAVIPKTAPWLDPL